MRSILKGAAVLGALLISPAHAATLTAHQIGVYPSFSIDFNDLNKNGLFEITELVSFSGFTTTGFGAAVLTRVLAVPGIPGFATLGSPPGVFPPSPGHWAFDAAGREDGFIDLASSSTSWTYQITGLSPVPLPSSLPLLAGALTLLAARRRRS